MDSVTQAALGACVTAACVPREHRRKALLLLRVGAQILATTRHLLERVLVPAQGREDPLEGVRNVAGRDRQRGFEPFRHLFGSPCLHSSAAVFGPSSSALRAWRCAVFPRRALRRSSRDRSCRSPPSCRPRRRRVRCGGRRRRRQPARPRRAGHLPPGMAMVSCEVEQLSDVPVPFRSPPATIAGAPYGGRRVAVVRGAAGEWLELIERLHS